MAHFFNLRSLLFYGGAIAGVLALFTASTTYGEANLKAPRPINGRFPMSSTSLPGCLKAQSVVLVIQQSGIYLNGALLTQDATEKVARIAEERPLLSGQWNNQQFSLAGATGYIPGCQTQVTIQGTLEQETLSGSLKLDSEPLPIAFSAQREAPAPTTKAH